MIEFTAKDGKWVVVKRLKDEHPLLKLYYALSISNTIERKLMEKLKEKEKLDEIFENNLKEIAEKVKRKVGRIAGKGAKEKELKEIAKNFAVRRLLGVI